jgi:hypothetical protein
MTSEEVGRSFAAQLDRLGLDHVLELFDGVAHPLTIVSWLTTPQPETDEKTPIIWLEAGGAIEPVRLAASRLAWRLAQ